ncbi:MAG: AEC family transporter [Oscillospiraceae bacterium]|nr:AEC family transporter [Oscillospiraceae bacterium]
MFLSNMMTALTQVVILYIIVALGFICHKAGIYTEKASRLTTDLLFYIITPAMIIRSFINMEYSAEALKGLGFTFLAALIFHVIGIVLSELVFCKMEQEKASIYKFASVYGNVGYMVLPLAESLLGNEGVFYCSAIVIPFNLLAFTHGAKIMTKGEGKSKISLKSLIVNPGFIGIAIGLPLFLLRFNLPHIFYMPLSYVADLQTPLAMVMFGTYIASADIKKVFSDYRVFVCATIKLFAMPLLTVLALKLLGFTGLLLVACTLSASAPTATNTVMFSAKFNKDTALASSVTAFISLISIFTMPLMVAIAQSA